MSENIETTIFVLPIKNKKKYIKKKCEHGKQKSQCRDCGGSQICEHGRQKSICRDCGGSQICEHEKRKSRCKDCGGSDFCEHDKKKSRCKDCGGSEICEHGKRKSGCKYCGGSEICEHNKCKSQCRDCGGSQICEHGRHKSICRDCGGSQICEHGKRKSRCKDCGGNEICEHNKLKSQCRDCGGSQICEHGKYKSCCRDCGGSLICEHGKQKSRCKDCGGSAFCKHGKYKYYCSECDGRLLCLSCKITIGNLTYDNHCLRCFIHLFPDKPVARNYKTKEKEVTTFVTSQFPDFQWIEDKRIVDGCSTKRPDLLLDLGYQVLVIEIDENQHQNYGYSCENKRMMTLSQDVGHRPIVFIRFNPDGYTNLSGTDVRSCWGIQKRTGICVTRPIMKRDWDNRLKVLKEQIEYWSNEENKTEKTIEVVHLFYDGF